MTTNWGSIVGHILDLAKAVAPLALGPVGTAGVQAIEKVRDLIDDVTAQGGDPEGQLAKPRAELEAAVNAHADKTKAGLRGEAQV